MESFCATMYGILSHFGPCPFFLFTDNSQQIWRGEMSSEAYKIHRSTPKTSSVSELSAKERGIGEPLPPIERDKAFKAGGWVSSAAQQRRNRNLDGGGILTKVRLRKSGAD